MKKKSTVKSLWAMKKHTEYEYTLWHPPEIKGELDYTLLKLHLDLFYLYQWHWYTERDKCQSPNWWPLGSPFIIFTYWMGNCLLRYNYSLLFTIILIALKPFPLHYRIWMVFRKPVIGFLIITDPCKTFLSGLWRWKWSSGLKESTNRSRSICLLVAARVRCKQEWRKNLFSLHLMWKVNVWVVNGKFGEDWWVHR